MENLSKKYYKVKIARGHLGAGNGLDTTFYFMADSAYDALGKARKMPGVKHGTFPSSVEEITEAEYVEGRKVSAYHKENQEMFKGANHKRSRYKF